MNTYKTAAELKTYEAALTLARANRKLHDFFRTQLVELSLTPPERGYLGILRNSSNLRVQTFAELLDVKPPFATRLGNKLAAKGLIMVSQDPNDARVRLITLTRDGAILIDESESYIRQNMKVYLKHINRNDLDTFLAVVDQISALPSRG